MLRLPASSVLSRSILLRSARRIEKDHDRQQEPRKPKRAYVACRIGKHRSRNGH